MLIDSHCHLYMGSWSNNLDVVLVRAKERGVSKIICPGIDIESSWQSLTIAKNYANVYAAAGIHPHDASNAPDDYIDQLRDILVQSKIVALGEIGLDYYRNISDANTQRKVFKQQLQLAKEMNLPVIVHNRAADADIIHLIQQASPIRGVAHCFTSDLITAKIFLEMGFYISFAGNLTYKNSELPKVAKEIPLDRLLIETDAPFLSPMPYRGKENEPSRLKYIADKLAECLAVSCEIIELATQNNADRLFSLPKS
ncbi:MAG: YchF/TatD family DNA exonuclease [Planctomycetia bacterium]|nr:YchF/TatD family DNA exonuclease [Planctomycetia bacterium]